MQKQQIIDSVGPHVFSNEQVAAMRMQNATCWAHRTSVADFSKQLLKVSGQDLRQLIEMCRGALGYYPNHAKMGPFLEILETHLKYSLKEIGEEQKDTIVQEIGSDLVVFNIFILKNEPVMFHKLTTENIEEIKNQGQNDSVIDLHKQQSIFFNIKTQEDIPELVLEVAQIDQDGFFHGKNCIRININNINHLGLMVFSTKKQNLMGPIYWYRFIMINTYVKMSVNNRMVFQFNNQL